MTLFFHIVMLDFLFVKTGSRLGCFILHIKEVISGLLSMYLFYILVRPSKCQNLESFRAPNCLDYYKMTELAI